MSESRHVEVEGVNDPEGEVAAASVIQNLDSSAVTLFDDAVLERFDFIPKTALLNSLLQEFSVRFESTGDLLHVVVGDVLVVLAPLLACAHCISQLGLINDFNAGEYAFFVYVGSFCLFKTVNKVGLEVELFVDVVFRATAADQILDEVAALLE